MKFVVQRDHFARLLSRAQGIVEKKSTVAVLSQVLIESVGEETIKMTCTDYDVVLIDRCPARILRQGRIVIPGRSIFDIVKVLPSVDIEIETSSDNSILVKAANRKYNLAAMDPDDFPRIEKPDTEPSVDVPVAIMRGLIRKTSFCMSQEEVRLNLNGVLFSFQSEADGVRLTCVATDGHRLAKVGSVLPGAVLPSLASNDVIVHRKGILEIKKIIEAETGNVTIGFLPGQSEVVFKVGSASLYVRLIEESFPDYESVIPAYSSNNLKISQRELVEEMRGVAPLADPQQLSVRMEMKAENLKITAQDPNKGSASTEMFAEFDGEPLFIGFNYKYLLEALEAVETERVVFKLTDSSSPALLQPENEGEDFSYVLMPVDD